MIAYQVSLNGKPVATAGVSQGVISAIANWVFIPSDVAVDPATDWGASISLAGLDHTTHQHLQWFRANLKVGDEVTLRLVDVDAVDPPTEQLINKSKEEIKRILDEEYRQSQQVEEGADGTPH